MPRLFYGPREFDFIADIAKELTKDVVGESIIIYPISEIKSDVHRVYEEAIDKVFENPIEVNCLIEWGDQEVKTGNMLSETKRTLSCHVQQRDLLDRGITIAEGDFFSYGAMFFEIVAATIPRLQYGQVEYENALKIEGIESRENLLKTAVLGRHEEHHIDGEIMPFHQQRGFEKNPDGLTGDTRELQRKGTLSVPITKPRQVSKQGNAGSVDKSFAFYDGDD